MNFNMNFAIAEHYQQVENAVEQLIALHHKGYNIYDEALVDVVIRSCGLSNDGFASEKSNILREVSRRIK